LWMFIRSPRDSLKLHDSSLLGRGRMDNLLEDHI
jgi:hypothetical protein